MTSIAIVTPVHAPGAAYLQEAMQSLQRQTDQDFSWYILQNGGGVAKLPHATFPVHIYGDPQKQWPGVGALKADLCQRAVADVLVELDADDMLAPDAIQRIREAFADPTVDFVYSDFAEFHSDSWKPNVYSAAYGWEHYPVAYEGHDLLAMRAPPATIHNMRRVEWAPNHVRVWRKKSYLGVGGHDAKMTVGDDHDLIVRMHLWGAKFHHIPHCLYFYRVHPKNTVSSHNAAIQKATHEVYCRSFYRMAERWAAGGGAYGRVDLCGGIDSPPDYFVLDREIHEKPGIACDLDRQWPLPDSSVRLLRANDAVEHLRDPIHTMNEAHRVLEPGGLFFIDVPSTSGKGAFCDPTHVSFWNDLSFRYYTDAKFARYVPSFVGKFQLLHLTEWFPTDWHREHQVPYVQAHLAALKEGYRPMGEVRW